jgi:hypothetical protein
MKTALYTLLVFFGLATPVAVMAQCAGCVPNTTLCGNTTGPCPNNLDTATVSASYNDTITFRLPRQVDASQQSGGLFGMVDFVQFKINSISGLPFGVNWSCDLGNCTYSPSSFPNGTFACVRFCGTPFAQPGSYPLVINTTGTVNTPFGNQSGTEIFNMTLVVQPAAAGGNAAFSIAPTQGCSPLSVQFSSNTPPGNFSPNQYNTGISYQWDFGNGSTDQTHTPPPVLYQSPGTYQVSYQEIVDTLPFVLQSVTAITVNCTDIAVFGTDNPDIYLRIFNGLGQSVVNTSGSPVTFTPSSNPHTWNVNLALTQQPYNVEIWDQDGGLYGADDNCFNNTENPFPFTPLTMPAASQYNVPVTIAFNQNGLHFNWKVQKTAFITQANDSVVVLPTPPNAVMGVQPGLTSCDRDSVELSVYAGYFYEWFQDDSLVFSGPASSFFAKDSGRYKVKVYDPVSGCFVVSNDTTLTFNPAPPPGFVNVGAAFSNGQLTTPLTGNYTYQWLVQQGGVWTPIPAPLGVIVPYTPTQNGSYALVATNAFGCSDTSNTVVVSSLGLVSGITSATLYPNPSNGSFALTLNDAPDGDYVLSVIDLAGKEVHQQPFTKIQGETQSFAVSLPNGLYQVWISGMGVKSVVKLLIQN